MCWMSSPEADEIIFNLEEEGKPRIPRRLSLNPRVCSIQEQLSQCPIPASRDHNELSQDNL